MAFHIYESILQTEKYDIGTFVPAYTLLILLPSSAPCVYYGALSYHFVTVESAPALLSRG